MKTVQAYSQVLPARYAVCPRCDGEGHHSNPAIDGNGITQSELAEILHDDSDFLDEYFAGVYDVRCECCSGQRVILEVDKESCTAGEWEQYQEDIDSELEHQAEIAAERRYMGAY